ncbi:MAG: hypothetical protein WBP51_05845, partial [Candidatus Sulfotelmatobacter sp.]
MQSVEVKQKKKWLLVAVLALFLLTSCALTVAQDVRTFVSSKAGDRITPKSVLHFQKDQNPSLANFVIDDRVAYQKMDGFGASFLEAGLICLNSLPASEREAVLRALFDP